MRYISDDNKVFNTEQECREYEKNLESERIKRERLERERQIKLETINQKYKDLQKALLEYEKDYGVKQRPYLAPVYELMNMLCG